MSEDLHEVCFFRLTDAETALAAGADVFFARALWVAGLALDRINRGELLRCLVCQEPITSMPDSFGWARPISSPIATDGFALCQFCGTDDAPDFRQRLLQALGGEGAYELAAGRA